MPTDQLMTNFFSLLNNIRNEYKHQRLKVTLPRKFEPKTDIACMTNNGPSAILKHGHKVLFAISLSQT